MTFFRPLVVRFGPWGISAVLAIAIVAWVAPHQMGVLIYKLALVTLAVPLTYWADRTLFACAPPVTAATFLTQNSSIASARLITRALIALAIILGLTLGL